MIPIPDLTFEYLLGMFGFLIMGSWVIVGLWKFSDSNLGVIMAYVGMIIGFVLIILGLNGAVGLGDWTDGKIDIWRDDITHEILNTECEDMKQLSQDYKKSNIDKFTLGQVEDEIQEEFIYKCVETRDQWWLK